jgi:DNA replication protein DnaC
MDSISGSITPERRVGDHVCPKHGMMLVEQFRVFSDWGDVRCPACREDELREIDERRERQKQLVAEQARADRLKHLIGRALIPARFADISFDGYEATHDKQRSALALCLEYAKEFEKRKKLGQGMIFCGNAGTGKTRMACAIANSVIRDHGQAAMYVTAGRAFRLVKDTYRRDSERTEQEAIAMFREPALLVLDEIGVQYGSDAEKNILFEIVNERYEALLPTILISNLAMKAFAEFAGDRVVDRMRENGGKLVVFDWDSHRGKAKSA